MASVRMAATSTNVSTSRNKSGSSWRDDKLKRSIELATIVNSANAIAMFALPVTGTDAGMRATAIIATAIAT